MKEGRKGWMDHSAGGGGTSSSREAARLVHKRKLYQVEEIKIFELLCMNIFTREIYGILFLSRLATFDWGGVLQ